MKPIELQDKIDGEQKKTTSVRMSKGEWVKYYACRMFALWQKHETPLGIAREYVVSIERDLCLLYDEPLKRMWIETSY